MSEFKRAMDLEQGVIDLATGEFPVTLFTNGEAKDGHILGIRGGVIPDSLPMFVNHDADPTKRAGQLITPAKFGDDRAIGDAAVKMIGRIDVQGDSAAADIRRDLAQGISVGDITAMSGRWDSVGEPTLRQNLDKSHYAYRETGMGFYFETWRALEGSIVGLGADSSALIGRAKDLSKPEHVREFWRTMTEAPPEIQASELSGQLAALAAQAREIPLLVPIQTDLGEVYVSQEVADVWERNREKDCGCRQARGESLGAYLSDLVDDRVTEDRPRSAIIESMGSAAGISAGTVNEILNGSIECPPIERLEAFADSLNTSLEGIVNAAERDGCNYEERQRAESHGDSDEPIAVEPTIRLGDNNTIEIGRKLQVDPDVFDQIRRNFEGQMETMRERITSGYKKILHEKIGRITDG